MLQVTKSNNSLLNIRQNSGDFVDLSCFRSLIHNDLAGQCICNIQGAGLVGGNNRAGSTSCMSAQSGPRANSQQIPSGPKFFRRGLEADPKQTPGPLSGSALVLGWVRSVLYIHDLCMTLAFDLDTKIICSPLICV